MNKIEVERELDSVMLYSQEPFVIDVAKVVCWGVEPEHCRISFTEQSLNEKYAKKVNYYDLYQYHVGYILYNGGGTTIENIVCPFFSYDKKLITFDCPNNVKIFYKDSEKPIRGKVLYV